MTARFLAPDATHLLCVGPDIGWVLQISLQVARGRQRHKDFMGGIYARKQSARAPAVAFLEGREGE